MFPWWLMDGDKYCLQILMGGLEGRYWLGNSKSGKQRSTYRPFPRTVCRRRQSTTCKWQDNGYQGEFLSPQVLATGMPTGWGVTCGWNIISVSGCYVPTTNTTIPLDNYQTLLWQNNGRYTWLGPTKLKISLVWLFGRKSKLQKGGIK